MMTSNPLPILVALLLVVPAVAQDADPPQPDAAQPQVAQQDAPSPGEAAQLAALRERLQRLLEQTGVPTDAQRKALGERLDAVAEQSAKLARELRDDRDRLEARQLELAARNVQVQQAYAAGDEREQSYRVGQLRTAAIRTKRLNAEPADTLSDFWLLQADLHDLNRATQETSERQRLAIELMERFVQSEAASQRLRNQAVRRNRGAAPSNAQSQASEPFAQDAAHQATIQRDVRLALLRLYDQQGMSQKVAALVKQMRRESPDDTALHNELNRWYGYTDLLGQQLEANLKLDGAADNEAAAAWSSSDHRGKIIVLCFWADWYAPSVEAAKQLRKRTADWNRDRYEVLFVQAPAEPTAAPANAPVPPDSPTDADAPAATEPSPTPAVPTQATQRDAASKTDSATAATHAWPTYHEGPGQVSLRRMLAVRTLPRFAVIDRTGRVAAVGGSLAILDRVTEMAASD